MNPYAIASGPLFPGQTGPGAGPDVARQLFERLQALAHGLQGLPNGAVIAEIWARAGFTPDPRHPMLLYTQRLPVT